MEKERGTIKCEIVKHFGVLNTYPTGWSKEFNLVKWNDNAEKYDIRDWAPGHERMSKGVTMREEEIRSLTEMCTGLFSEAKPEVEEKVSGENSVAADNSGTGTGVQVIMPEELSERATEDVPF